MSTSKNSKRSKAQRKADRISANESRRDFSNVRILPNLKAAEVDAWYINDVFDETQKIEPPKKQKIIKVDNTALVEQIKARRDDFRIRHDRYMKSPEWRALKQLYRADNSRYQKCWSCGVPKELKPHQFHHLHYDTFMCESLDDIIPVCEECHKKIHNTHKANKGKSLRKTTLELCTSTVKERNLLTQNAS